MGVPAFYRWLVGKYPKIVVDAKEERSGGTAPNPNGIEFDNLYLDMNGIIHPSFHPDDCDPRAHLPTTYEDVFQDVFQWIDRIFATVRPRKLLFLAFDGVAPRAKLNQQRTRVVRHAKTQELKKEEEKRLREEYMKVGKKVLPQAEGGQLDDWSVIAPGTEFMFEMSKALQRHIRNRISENPAWGDIKVILSDANVPGEGEEKIISFIRCQRAQPGYNPNTRHCVHGMDADLIMLALATHELHFTILREKMDGSSGTSYPLNNLCTYQFLHVWILREYLELELRLPDLPEGVRYDLERVIDDFVFTCFFVGNDFLPPMPTLDVHEGAIELLMDVYKKEFRNFGGYLTDTQRVNEPHAAAAYINLEGVERFILSIASYEEKIFDKRERMKERLMIRIQSEPTDSPGQVKSCDHHNATTITDVGSIPFPTVYSGTAQQQDDILRNTKSFKEDLNRMVKERSDMYKTGLATDKVKFGSLGWKQRYYKEKFFSHNPQEVERTRKAIVKEYAEGLCWVLLYYFSGVPSWSWFYPYQYGPCASDLEGLSQVKVKFEMGSPFTPFDHLTAVLPRGSAHALPRAYRRLVTDPCSDLLSIYHKEVDVDLDGKRHLWQGVCRLPFIDDKLLLSATRKVAREIEDYEAERNAVKVAKLFVRASSKFGSLIQPLLKQANAANSSEALSYVGTEVSLSGETDDLSGLINLSDDLLCEADNMVLCVNYEVPKLREIIHGPLVGVSFPKRTVLQSDIVDRLLWHEHNYHYHVSRICGQDGYPIYVNPWGHAVLNPFVSSWNPMSFGRGASTSSLTTGLGNFTTQKSDSVQAYIPPHLRR